MENKEMFIRRLQMIGAILSVVAVMMVVRLVSIQFQMDPEEVAFFKAQAQQYTRLVEYMPTRGEIYDRNGEALAVNLLEYEIGANPPFITEPAEVAKQLAPVLDISEVDLYNQLSSDNSWVLLARPVNAAVGQAVEDLAISGIETAPIPVRSYPQGMLGAQVLGFVGYDELGRYGVEGLISRIWPGKVW